METRRDYEGELVGQHGFEQAIYIPESKDYGSYLNNLFLVQKNGTRGVAAVGAARISMVLECTRDNMEAAKEYATTVCKMQSENYLQRNNKEYKDTTFNDVNKH